MDKKKRLILIEITLIVILLITCVVIQYRITNFSRDCKINYDLNSSCPCKEQFLDNNNYKNGLNNSFFNLSNNLT